MPQLAMSALAGADIDDREKLRQAGTSGDAVHSGPVPTKPRNITEIGRECIAPDIPGE